MVTVLKTVGSLVAIVLLVAALATSYQPRSQRHPSKLERTCPFQGGWVPCFIVDEATSPQWNV